MQSWLLRKFRRSEENQIKISILDTEPELWLMNFLLLLPVFSVQPNVGYLDNTHTVVKRVCDLAKM